MAEVIPNQYQDLWIKAKEEYRTATGSKRPGEKRLWGLFGDRFQKSTEIGDACKEVDDALKNIRDKKTGLKTEKGIEKAKEALKKLTAKKDTYLRRLDQELEAEGTKLEALLAKETRESRKSLAIAEKKQDPKAVKAAEKAVAEAEKNQLEHAAAVKAAQSKTSALGTLKSALNVLTRTLSSHIDAFVREGAPDMSPEEITKAFLLMSLKDKPNLVITLSEQIGKACEAVLKEKAAVDQLRVFNSGLYGTGDKALMRRLGAALETLRPFYPPEQKNWQKVFDKYGNANAGNVKALEDKDVKKAVKAIAEVVTETKKFGTTMKKKADRGI